MTDEGLDYLIARIALAPDCNGWVEVGGGASVRLIPGILSDASPGPSGVVICCPDGDGRFFLLARLAPHILPLPGRLAPTLVYKQKGQAHRYDHAGFAQAVADDMIRVGAKPAAGRRRYPGKYWRIDPIRFLLPSPFGKGAWSVLPPDAELALLPHLRPHVPPRPDPQSGPEPLPVRAFDPAVLAPILPARPSGLALDAAATIMAWNQREHFRWGDQNPIEWNSYRGHAAPSAAACRATLDQLVAAAVRHLAETGEDPVARVKRHLAAFFNDPLAELISSLVSSPHNDLAGRAAQYVPSVVAAASDLTMRRFAVEVAGFNLFHGLEALRRPLAAFARATTDDARHAAVAALQDILQREADAGRLTLGGLQQLFDTWSFGIGCPQITITATPRRAA